ncbi:hypothetical protein DFH06DRAFT_483340 [Mycena polygramma]|nr:hypothetical protein DFH06DRAFT_483340 [Mycena polygramma]
MCFHTFPKSVGQKPLAVEASRRMVIINCGRSTASSPALSGTARLEERLKRTLRVSTLLRQLRCSWPQVRRADGPKLFFRANTLLVHLHSAYGIRRAFPLRFCSEFNTHISAKHRRTSGRFGHRRLINTKRLICRMLLSLLVCPVSLESIILEAENHILPDLFQFGSLAALPHRAYARCRQIQSSTWSECGQFISSVPVLIFFPASPHGFRRGGLSVAAMPVGCTDTSS